LNTRKEEFQTLFLLMDLRWSLLSLVAGLAGGIIMIQTIINLAMTSGFAKAALTIPIIAPFSDLTDLSRQATVMAFQFGDGFTNMITPTVTMKLNGL